MRAPRLPLLLALAALALLSASSVGAAGSSVTTFADGSATIPVPLTTACGSSATPGVALPPAANVSAAEVTVSWPVPPSPSASIMFDIGGDGSWDIASQYGGSPTSLVHLPAARFNAYLSAQPAGPSNITVPIRLQGCGSPAGNATLGTLLVNFAAPAAPPPPPPAPPPPANLAPALTAAFEPVALDDTGGHTVRIPLSAHFVDPEGDALVFSLERVDPASAGWLSVTATVDGADLVVVGDANWSGALALTVTATDAGGLSVTAPPLSIMSTALPAPPGAPPPDSTPPPEPTPSASAASAAPLVAAGAVLLGAAALLSLEAVRYAVLSALLVLLGASRRPASPTDHFVRGRLYQLIRDRPGVRFRELIRLAEVSNGAGVHHLRLLEEAGFVRAVRSGRQTQFFPGDHAFRADEYGLLDYERAVIEAVARQPGITVQETARAAGVSKSTASRAVARLTRSGHLTRQRRGRNASLHVREGVSLALRTPHPAGPGRTEAGGPAP